MTERSRDVPCEERTGPHGSPLSQLQLLLDAQMEEAQRGSLAAVAALAQQSERLVEHLTSNGTVVTAEFKAGKAAVQDSYNRLLLTLAAADQDLADQLASVRQGRKLVHAYRRNVR